MIVDLGRSTKAEPFHNKTATSAAEPPERSIQLTIRRPRFTFGEYARGRILGLPHQQEEGSHGLRKKDSTSSLLKTPMTEILEV